MNCSDCKYGAQNLANPDGQSLLCTRFPPTAFITNVKRDDGGRIIGTEQLGVFPIVALTTLCGEHFPAGNPN